MSYPFSREAPDAESGFWERFTMDRTVLPEGALSASDRHVWIVVTSTEIETMSTPAFREWLDTSASTDHAAMYVLPAARPHPAAPLRVTVHHATPTSDHEIHVVSDSARRSAWVSFTSYPRLK